MRHNFPLALTFFFILGEVVLLGLGSWQLFVRLPYKQGLIARMTAEMNADIKPLGLDLEASHRPFLIKGKIDTNRSIMMGSFTERGISGAHLVSLLTLEDGRHFAFNRGWVPKNFKEPSVLLPFEGRIVLKEPQNLGYDQPDRLNVPQRGFWITALPGQLAPLWDVKKLQPLIAFHIMEYPASQKMSLPFAHRHRLNIPNNHGYYAATWYMVALSLLIIYFIMLRRAL